MKLTIEFRYILELISTDQHSGGLELLFNKIKKYDVELKEDSITLKGLLQWMKDNLLKERPELFLQDTTV
jgi:ubiquitin related modifier 1